MHPYIDIHTHHYPTPGASHLAITSLYDDFGRAASGMPCSLGLHPWYISDREAQLEALGQFAPLSNVLAIGECGLDKVCDTPWDVQVTAFTSQIGLANQLGKPLIIHCVRAFEELIATFKQYPPAVPVIIHGFNKGGDVAERLLANGYYLSFGTALLNENSPATAALRKTPADRFFLETDDAVIPIADIYRRAAEIRETTPEAIILQLQQNFKTAFNQ